MKPCEEMHAAVEEVDLDPCDLYTELGTLIVEGRVPGLTDKGFGEGPHCFSSSHGQNRHQCDVVSPECQKYDQILKHMLLLWKNGIPMTIEVLLYPGCCAPFQNVDSVPDMPYILLEQWTIHMLPRRVPDASISPRGLIQAVRSFLYFSQLCAWYSLTGGKSPQNVHYRVCVPGEAFSSKFSTQPDCHLFPVANIGRGAAMKVLMKCLPRCGEIPSVPCHRHNLPLKAIANPAKATPGPYANLFDGILPAGMSSRTGSPADSMLGESLLDPPNSLCMYPRRYQSPSRCGSPSIEVPEHLMFGGLAKGGQAPDHTPPRRSRPQRRPVVERFLKKDLGNPLCGSPELKATARTPDRRRPEGDILALKREGGLKQQVRRTDNAPQDILALKRDAVLKQMGRATDGTAPQDILSLKRDAVRSFCCIEDGLRKRRTEGQGRPKDIMALRREAVLSYCCLEEGMGHVPREEMDRVLLRLREKREWRKCGGGSSSSGGGDGRGDTLGTTDQGKPLEKYFEELRIGPGGRTAADRSSQNYFVKVHNCDGPSRRPGDAGKANNNCDNNGDGGKPRPDPGERLHPGSSQLPGDDDDDFIKKLNFQNRTLSERLGPPPSFASRPAPSAVAKEPGCTYHQQATNGGPGVVAAAGHPAAKASAVNIKKCGAFLARKTEELTDERELPEIDKDSAHPPDVFLDDDDAEGNVYPEVPSAEKKAFFRRSLDSATSLVFHKRSGLPLTSSPAPIRKNGTRFDYDCTLTTVSAIKRALFEKEAEQEVEERDANCNLSISAPASIFSSSLLGTFEESVLNGRLEPVSTVEGFTADIGASGSFCPRHIRIPVTVFFYTLHDMDKVASPYMGHINLRGKDYHVPKKGTVQVTLFNPHDTVVKMFVIRYDLSDMPINCQTFLRQRTLYMPSDATDGDEDAQKWLRYLIHLRFLSSKSGRIYLHTDIRLIIFRKSDLDAATVHGQRPYELRTFTHGPSNPKFSPHKP